MTGPLKPSEVAGRKRKNLPEYVFEAFNALIVRHWDGDRAVIRQNDVVEAILAGGKVSRQEVFTQHMLDIEEAYRSVGWVVTYDKPGFNELGEATFEFRRSSEKHGSDGGFSPAPFSGV